MTSTTEPAARMKSEDRRELILEAATQVFGDRGFVGTTTDQVAKAAGVSQPYVVRMFGTKQQLFLEVLHRAVTVLLSTFRAVLAEQSDEPIASRLGYAYWQLSRDDTGMQLSLMHAFVLGADPVIGEAARVGFLEIYDLLRTEGGFSAEEATQFFANGMLINTLVGLRMEQEKSDVESARELLFCAYPEERD